MLTGMPSILMARSVPWSRLKPRKKYWLALPSPECWVTISPGTTSSASPGRAKGWAFTSAPLMVMALAAVGCMYAGPAVADPDVTPLLTCDGTAALGWTADGFRAVRSRRDGLGRLRGLASGGVTVTAGSWSGHPTATLCASAGRTTTNSDAAAENAPRAAPRNALPPNDNCYTRRTTATARPNPARHASSAV